MDFATPFIGIVTVLCCIVLPIALVVIGWFVIPTPDGILNRLYWGGVHKEAENEKKYRNDLILIGVTAPAKIISLRGLGSTRKLDGGSYKELVEYEVEVMPEGQLSFQAKIQYWLPIVGKHGLGEAIREETAQKIWVTYNPVDPSQIIYDHNEKDRAQVLAVREVAKKRNHFIDMEQEAIRIRETGIEVLAAVLEVEQLGVELEKEKKESRSVRIKFKATPQQGADFESETYAMLALESVPKMIPGKKVYIKYDPQKPEISALIRSANS